MNISGRYTSPVAPPVLQSKPTNATRRSCVPILSLHGTRSHGHTHPPLISFGWARVAAPGTTR